MAKTKRRTVTPFVSDDLPKRVKLSKTITITREQHDTLVTYIRERLEFGDELREDFVERLRQIDQEFNGFITLDKQDRKRLQDIRRGQPSTTDINLELAAVQIQNIVTYMMSVFAPDEGMYRAVSTKDMQNISNGFTNKMNDDAQYFGHFQQLARSFFDMFKYNVGGTVTQWDKVWGTEMTARQTGGVDLNESFVYQGNSLSAVDMYNCIWDITVPITKIAQEGEFVFMIDLKTPFRLKKMLAQDMIFNVKIKEIDDGKFLSSTGEDVDYFEEPPELLIEPHINTNYNVDWRSTLSGTIFKKEVGGKHEFIRGYIWLPSKKFGLSTSDKYEIWYIEMLRDRRIVFIEKMENAHGMLPVSFGMPRSDGMEMFKKSFAEQMIPLQRFATSEFNIHQRAARKRLYGVTVYNSQAIPLMERADMLGGKVPWNPSAIDQDVNKAVLQLNDAPNTDKTMDNVARVIELMEQYLPTQIAQQIAGLERAVQYQVAALVESGERTNYFLAKLLNDQCLRISRFQMMYNIIQFAGAIQVMNDNGELEEIPSSAIIGAGLEFDIDFGLKGLQRVILNETLKEMTGMVLQSADAQQKIDVVKLLNHVTSMYGDTIDYDQYKFVNDFDRLSQQEKQVAFNLLTQLAQQQQDQDGQPNGGTGAALPVARGAPTNVA